MTKEERRKRARETPSELEPTALESAEATALRRALDGEEQTPSGSSETAELLETAALLRASRDLPNTAESVRAVTEARDGLLASSRWSTGKRAAGPASSWVSRFLGRGRRLGWPILFPVGAAAALGVVAVVTTHHPMTERAPMAEMSREQERPTPVVAQTPGSPEPSSVQVDPGAEAMGLTPASSRLAIWVELPRPPEALLSTQATVATIDAAGLWSLRQPMAEYRRRVYSILSARYRRQASSGTSGKLVRVAGR